MEALVCVSGEGEGSDREGDAELEWEGGREGGGTLTPHAIPKRPPFDPLP